MILRFTLLAAAVAIPAFLVGCTQDPGFTGVSGVRTAEASEVAGCRYVADIRMIPGVYGALADQGLRYARNKMLADAKSAGADALVFEKTVPGVAVYELRATAYRCAP